MRLHPTDSSLTVRFYSAKLGRSVQTETGDPYARVGATGFTVEYTRRVYRYEEVGLRRASGS